MKLHHQPQPQRAGTDPRSAVILASLQEATLASREAREGLRLGAGDERPAEAMEAWQLASAREQAALELDWQVRRERELAEALDRIRDGKYGICQDCEEEIEARRLKALPGAARCLGCQERWERRGMAEAQEG